MFNSFAIQVEQVAVLLTLSLLTGCGDVGSAPSHKKEDKPSLTNSPVVAFMNSPVTRITLKDYSGLESGSAIIESELDEVQMKSYLEIFDKHKDSTSDLIPPSPPAYKFTIYTKDKNYDVTYIHSKQHYRFQGHAGFLSEDTANDLSWLIARIQQK